MLEHKISLSKGDGLPITRHTKHFHIEIRYRARFSGQASRFMEPIMKNVPEIRPLGIGTFAGALDYNKLSWLNRNILKAKGAPEGDFRDWNSIRTWAQEPVYARFAQ